MAKNNSNNESKNNVVIDDLFATDDAVVVGGEEDTTKQIRDIFPFDVAKKFAFIGVGACGGRIVDSFYKYGYRRCLVINTTAADMQELHTDLEKIDMQIGGAGKTPLVAKERVLIPDNRESIRQAIDEVIGRDFDYGLVCAGLGGGTGSGAGPEIFRLLREHADASGLEPKRIGCILSIPQAAEGPRVCENALYAYEEFLSLTPTPCILIDNSKVASLKKTSYLTFYSTANKEATMLLHACNRFAAMSSQQTFDPSDFSKVLDSGLITFGRSTIPNWSEGKKVVAKAILETFRSASLAEVNLKTATQAACIVAAGQRVLEQFSMNELMEGIDVLSNVSDTKIMLHPAVYLADTNPDSLQVYTIIGGLTPGEQTLKVLAKAARMDVPSKLAQFFDVS
jgi:cell division GTPase FtsZ